MANVETETQCAEWLGTGSACVQYVKREDSGSSQSVCIAFRRGCTTDSPLARGRSHAWAQQKEGKTQGRPENGHTTHKPLHARHQLSGEPKALSPPVNTHDTMQSLRAPKSSSCSHRRARPGPRTRVVSYVVDVKPQQQQAPVQAQPHEDADAFEGNASKCPVLRSVARLSHAPRISRPFAKPTTTTDLSSVAITVRNHCLCSLPKQRKCISVQNA